MPGPNTTSLETSHRLETEMSGLRAQLTRLRSDSIDTSTHLLAILAPMPAGAAARCDVVTAVRVTPEISLRSIDV